MTGAPALLPTKGVTIPGVRSVANAIYQIGGSLQLHARTYVTRAADAELYAALSSGEYCYVFNARQMGKSSLRVHMQQQLQADGHRCVSLDLSSIGSEHITPSQWYKGMVLDLLSKFDLLHQIDFKNWWIGHEGLSNPHRFRLFLEEILLAHYPTEQLYIFVDEIDSALALPFPVDDFFAVVRYCYNQRADDDQYQRLTWALFGVVTPSELIFNSQRTPFNIGRAISLRGFRCQEAAPLAAGFVPYADDPMAVLRAVLDWTNGQPFLTQKLCGLVTERLMGTSAALPGVLVDQVVQQCILQNWESQDNPEHLRTIRDRILRNEQRAGRLLGLYQRVLQHSADGTLLYTDSPDQVELLLSGLIENQDGCLRVKNHIYAAIFDNCWVEQQLSQLRPYAAALTAWDASHQTDESRLLQGAALAEAQDWSRGKSLSDKDYRFLAASDRYARQLMQNQLKAAKAQAVQTQLAIQRQSLQRLATLSGVLAAALVVLLTFGFEIFRQRRQVNARAVEAMAASANALFASDQRLDSLVQALSAAKLLEDYGLTDTRVATDVTRVLQQAVFGLSEVNRISGFETGLLSVVVSSDARLMATSGDSGTIRLWDRRGRLLQTLMGHKTRVHQLAFSDDDQLLVSAGNDATVRLWGRDGQLLRAIRGHSRAVTSVAVGPGHDPLIASASSDQLVHLWTTQGERIMTLKGHTGGVTGVAFSPDGQRIASVDEQGQLLLWTLAGDLIQQVDAHEDSVSHVVFSPDGRQLATASHDRTVKIWDAQGNHRNTLRGHLLAVTEVAFSHDGKQLASASWDRTVRLWSAQGTLLRTLSGHRNRVQSVAFAPGDYQLMSGASDKTVRIWQLSQFASQSLYGHQADVVDLAVSPNTQVLATGGDDSTLQLWNRRGEQVRIFTHPDAVLGISFAPDGQTLATGSWDSDIRIWSLSGELEHRLSAHIGPVWDVVFSPDGRSLVSASEDHTVGFWDLDTGGYRSLLAHRYGVRSVAFSPDGQWFASAGLGGEVRLWTAAGAPIRRLQSSAQLGYTDVAISPDGEVLAAGGFDQTVEVWHRDGEHLLSLGGHGQEVRSVGFSPDGQQIVAATGDGTLKFWSLSGELLNTLQGHDGAVWQVEYIAGSNTLMSVSEDRSSILWRLSVFQNLEQLQTYGCTVARHYLSYNSEVKTDPDVICDALGP